MTTSAARPDVAAEAGPSDLPARAAALAAQLRERADEAAAAGTLPPDVVGRLESAGMTVGELRAALDDATAHPGRFSLVQAVVPRDDVPGPLSALTAVLGRAVRSTS